MLGQVLGFAVFLPQDPSLDWPEEPLHIRCREGRMQAELTGAHRTAGTRRAYRRRRDLGGTLSPLGPRLGLARSAARREATLDTGRRERAGPTGWRRPIRPSSNAIFRLAEGCRRLCRRPRRDAHALSRAPAGRPAHAPRWRCLIDRRLYEARRLSARHHAARADHREGDRVRLAPPYFSRAFRSEIGTSPTEFRNARVGRIL